MQWLSSLIQPDEFSDSYGHPSHDRLKELWSAYAVRHLLFLHGLLEHIVRLDLLNGTPITFELILHPSSPRSFYYPDCIIKGPREIKERLSLQQDPDDSTFVAVLDTWIYYAHRLHILSPGDTIGIENNVIVFNVKNQPSFKG